MIEHAGSPQPMESRLELLEDIEAIVRVKNLYLRRFDAVVNGTPEADGIAELLAPNVVWESDHFGALQGVSAVESFLADYTKRVSFSLQFISGQSVDVSGDRMRAFGRWVLWQPLTLDGDAWVLGGHYNDGFTRMDSEWKLDTVRLDVAFLAPWQEAWGKDLVSPEWHWAMSDGVVQ